ncbi:trigger factor [Oceanicoccus sagamiensis]|uniref:Trigger factor n=1 Tax=Oceanicoccus sagamiensis TaxID=716816 RepID=A0A1X9NL32_9GAMM|nr:trigger factor [Oceanicoccus sagamiensis]ARN75547.1 trigger factor [Oceanicoccus sagamiensis]
MQVSIQTTSGLERKLTVGIPAERVDNEVNARLQKASKTVRLDGFRPGKVPMKVMKQRFGAGVRQEVMQEVMNQSFSEAIAQEDLKPAGMPSIEPKNIEAGSDLEYVATFEIFPEIESKDYSSMAIEKPVAEVGDADISKMIETLREQQSSWEEVERAAAEGDQVNINFAGTKDGEAFDGGTADNSPLELGSNTMIPGFEDGIVGMKAGDEKVLSLSFPEDYHAEELKGAAVEFAVTVNSVAEKKLAELNDELFEKFGVKEGGEEKFREDVAENMKRELENATKAKVKNQVMDSLVASHDDLQIPQALIKQEITVLKQQMVQQFGGQAASLDVDSLLPDDMFTEQADRRVRLGLVLNDYISKEALTADPDKVKETIEGFASTYEDPEEVINYYYSNQQQLQEIQSMVLEDSVVEKLMEQATVTDKACSYEEVMAPAAPPEAAED